MRIEVIGLLVSFHLGAALMAQDCRMLTATKQSELTEFVRKQYDLKSESALKLVQDRPLSHSCYRELTFQGKSPVKTWEITMYLSPDERFLTGELFDTTIDPVEERRRRSRSLMTSLAENKGTSKGSERAPVTIVEFSDFQCPFCRKFAELLQKVFPERKDDVRLVFHHMPLSMHSWASAAANGSACAQIQSSAAFWSMHDQLFEHQPEINALNVKEKLLAYAKKTELLDMAAFKTCLDDQMSLGLVYRDSKLAMANGVDGTPTIFINGHRMLGVKDADQLRNLINEAKDEAIKPPSIDSESARSQSGGLR